MADKRPQPKIGAPPPLDVSRARDLYWNDIRSGVSDHYTPAARQIFHDMPATPTHYARHRDYVDSVVQGGDVSPRMVAFYNSLGVTDPSEIRRHEIQAQSELLAKQIQAAQDFLALKEVMNKGSKAVDAESKINADNFHKPLNQYIREYDNEQKYGGPPPGTANAKSFREKRELLLGQREPRMSELFSPPLIPPIKRPPAPRADTK